MSKLLTRACSGACALLLFSSAQAGSIDPDLQQAIDDTTARLPPGQVDKVEIDVIVRFENPLDPVATSAPGFEHNNPNASKPNRGRATATLIRALKDNTAVAQQPVLEFLSQPGAISKVKNIQNLWIINGMSMTIQAGLIPELAKLDGIDTVGLDAAMSVPSTTTTSSAPGGWNLNDIGADVLWNLGITGQGIVVATLDSGVDYYHADLGPRWRGGNNSWYDPFGENPSPNDVAGHGTEVLGVMIGGDATGTSLGVAPDAQWIAAKIYDNAGNGSYSITHLAFQWVLDPDGNPATDDAPDVVNNSWGFTQYTGACDDEFRLDIQALNAAGIAVVYSAGNSGPSSNTDISPANEALVSAVGAVDDTWNVANFSSRGPSACSEGLFPEISAPGVNVQTAGLTYGGIFPTMVSYASGTSLAAPHLAGGLALLISADPSASLPDLKNAISASAVDIAAVGDDHDSGHGMLNLAGAYNVLTGGGGGSNPGSLQFDTSSVSVDETAGAVSLTVTRVGGSDGTVTADYASADGSANAGLDYQASAGTVSLGDGITSTVVNIGILDDGDAEGDEDFSVGLANPSGGATLGSPTTTTVTIVDDEPSGPADVDGDGYTTDDDCDDNDAGVYPGATEVVKDGVDQDCNGYDLTLVIDRAVYANRKDRIVVDVYSDLNENAALEAVGWGPLRWLRNKGFWRLKVEPAGGDPGSVTITGIEGSITTTLQ